MKDEKGQALIEFILILPVILLVFVALIDIGNIFLQKYNLNNSMETVTELYQNEKSTELRAFAAKEELIYDEEINGEMVNLILKKTIKISAPGLNNAIGKNYTIEAKKTVYKEENKNE